MKVTEQYFPVVLFVMLYKVVPKCFSLCLIDGVSVVVHFLSQVIFASLFLGMVIKLKQRKNNNYLRKNNELQNIHLNESYIAALSSVTVYYALQDGCNF